MKVRTAKIKDLKKCASLSKIPELRLAYTTKGYPNINYLKEFLGYLFIVAENEQGNILGYLIGEKEKAGVVCLNILVVDIKHHNEGIGNLLLKEFLKRAKKLGLKNIYFVAPNWNKKTLEFYRKNGFTEMKYYSYFTSEI